MVYLLRRACSEGYLEQLRLVNALWLEPDLWLLSLRPGAPDWSRRTRERGDNSVRFAPRLSSKHSSTRSGAGQGQDGGIVLM